MPTLSARLPDPLPWPELARPLARAEDALARLDERLRTSPIRDGWIARTHFVDAVAALWLEGELVHIDDLVLHDAGMDIPAPTHALTRPRRPATAIRSSTTRTGTRTRAWCNGAPSSTSPAICRRLSPLRSPTRPGVRSSRCSARPASAGCSPPLCCASAIKPAPICRV